VLHPAESDVDASNEAGDDDDDEEEVDPLEAFMAEVDATEEVVPQQSVYGLSSQPAERAPPTQNAATTISLDDLMRMSSVPSSNSKESEGWESDAASEVEDEGDEEQQERDRLEFMKAIRGLHGAPPAASAAASSASAAPGNSTLERGAAPGQVKSTAVAAEDAELPKPAKAKGKPQLGRMFGDEGDVMEEHEREVPCRLNTL
jgi:hypothetical protein